MIGRTNEIPCPLRAAAQATPDSPAIVGVDGTTTYRELDLRVSSVAERLREGGCVLGSRVALYLEKDERYIVLLLALVLRVGAVACPISTRTPPDGVPPLIETARCSDVISSEETVLNAASAQISRLNPHVLLEDLDNSTSRDLEDLLHLDLRESATIVFTSGSTGSPKAALHTLGNHYYSALGSNANIKLDPGDRWLHSLPLHHVGGISILFRVLLSRTTLALPETTATLGESITRLEATHISLVATQLRRMLAEDDVPAGLKAILMGASAMPPGLIHEAHSRGLPLHTSYGLTELASQVSATAPDASLEQLKTSGNVLAHREYRVDESGEILVRGETLFTGYVEGDQIIRPFDADGWFHTKDLGIQTSDGFLIVHGRKDNLFISGGENIQPEEIEEAFLDLPGVSEAVVVDIPDPEFGYRPVAFVRRSGTDTSMNLQEELYRVLPRFKVPKTIHAWPADAPEGMKVDRSFMRDRALRLSVEG